MAQKIARENLSLSSPDTFSALHTLLEPPSLRLSLSFSVWNVLSLSFILCCLSLLLAVGRRAYSLHLYRKSPNNPPTFDGLQLLGFVYRAWKEKGLSLTQIPEMKELFHQQLGPVYAAFPPIFRLFLSFSGREEPLRYEICDPDIAKSVVADKKLFLQQRIAPHQPRRFKPLAEGLLGLPMGDVWSRHRRLLSPLFSEKYLQIYHEAVSEKAAQLRDLWTQLSTLRGDKPGERNAEQERRGSKAEEGEVVEISRDLTLVTLDVIGSAGFGVEFSSLSDPLSPYAEAGKWLFHTAIRLSVFPTWLHYLERRGKRKCDEALSLYEKMLERVIEENAEENAARQERENFVSVLLKAQKEVGEKDPLSVEEVKAEMLTMLIAGHETTANTLSWCLFLLAKHPEKQQKLREEILSVLPDNKDDREGEGEAGEKKGDGPPLLSFSHLSQLPYARACFYEALRVYPTVPGLNRVVAEDCEVRGVAFKKHSFALVNYNVLAKDPAVWDNPLEFLPERFLRDEEEEEGGAKALGEGGEQRRKVKVLSPETASNVPYAFLPFGAGPRSCIGKRFAVNEGLMLLCTVLRDLEFSLVEGEKDPEPQFSVTVSPKGGIRLRVKERRRQQAV